MKKLKAVAAVLCAGAVFAASEGCFCAPSEFLLSPERLPSAFNKFNNANFSVIKFPF